MHEGCKDEFYKLMKEKRLDEIKNIELPVVKQTRKNKERILPYPKQLVEKEEKTESTMGEVLQK